MFLLQTQNVAYQNTLSQTSISVCIAAALRGKRGLFRIRLFANILLLRTDRTKKYTWAPTVISLVLTISGKITCNIISCIERLETDTSSEKYLTVWQILQWLEIWTSRSPEDDENNGRKVQVRIWVQKKWKNKKVQFCTGVSMMSSDLQFFNTRTTNCSIIQDTFVAYISGKVASSVQHIAHMSEPEESFKLHSLPAAQQSVCLLLPTIRPMLSAQQSNNITKHL